MNTGRAAHDWEVRCHRLEVHERCTGSRTRADRRGRDKWATLLWVGTFEGWDPIRAVVCVEPRSSRAGLAGAGWELRAVTPADWEEDRGGPRRRSPSRSPRATCSSPADGGFDAVGWAAPGTPRDVRRGVGVDADPAGLRRAAAARRARRTKRARRWPISGRADDDAAGVHDVAAPSDEFRLRARCGWRGGRCVHRFVCERYAARARRECRSAGLGKQRPPRLLRRARPGVGHARRAGREVARRGGGSRPSRVRVHGLGPGAADRSRRCSSAGGPRSRWSGTSHARGRRLDPRGAETELCVGGRGASEGRLRRLDGGRGGRVTPTSSC